jgi:hypothetical protein
MITNLWIGKLFSDSHQKDFILAPLEFSEPYIWSRGAADSADL